jgi:hypothetical protein
VSTRLISIFLPQTPIHLDAEEGNSETDPKTLWKVVLRTGVWKLRPGPGGVKLNAPLKIYRDKAPKGHISLSSLKANFDAGAKENVTIPVVHADGTTSDSGFVRKLVIQDVNGEDGSDSKESLLWAEMDVTDSEIRRKIEEKSLVGVSGGILFDYQRTEDAKKFDQILSHVMVTNSPWINGTGGFVDKLPGGVMASEPDDLPIGEVEFQSRVTDAGPKFPAVQLDNPPNNKPPESGKATGKVVWKPEQGLEYAKGKIRKALDDSRQALLSRLPENQRYSLDWPRFSVSDVSLEGEGGTALITSGYGSEQDTWVTGFKFDSDREVELDPFVGWTPAKQEWVAASEEPPPPPSVRPAGRDNPPPARATGLIAHRSPGDLGLREAQAARAERMRLGTNPTSISGGNVSRISDLLSRGDLQLSDEDREILLAEGRRLAGFEQSETQRIESARKAEVVAFCGSPDGETKGLLDKIGLGDPGVKKYVRNAILSDDGQPAIELAEHLSDGQKTTGVPKTATDLLKGFIEILPKVDGKVSLAEQARRLPDDPKPPEDAAKKTEDPKAGADALLAEFHEQGFGENLVVPKGA